MSGISTYHPNTNVHLIIQRSLLARLHGRCSLVTVKKYNIIKIHIFIQRPLRRKYIIGIGKEYSAEK